MQVVRVWDALLSPPRQRCDDKADAVGGGGRQRLRAVVLDDVWHSAHEKQLNCIDTNTASKLFVTTRIRGLLKGCDEISLNLLSHTEAVDLLLRSGGVDSAVAAVLVFDRD